MAKPRGSKHKFQWEPEEAAFLAGVMSLQGAFVMGSKDTVAKWQMGTRREPLTVGAVAEMVGEELRVGKRGNYVVVRQPKLDRLMEHVQDWLDPDRYAQYLAVCDLVAEEKQRRADAQAEKAALRKSRIREMALMTRQKSRELAEETYYNQDPAVQVIEDNDVVEAEINRALAKRAAEKLRAKRMMRSI